ncbi:hypothetical protein F4780DRAFT_781135 [Xylariomycetidae sp. FL0641]|nr:hypothetical protein F4780DRAFT_781135 [Xylariomycetidae sp. FL0641]
MTSQPVDARPAKRKVKTGCRTCKVRRVKCDEGRPACQRCLSTSRVCEGYGIWGGGNRPPASRPPSPKPIPGTVTTVRCLSPSFLSRASSEQQGCFQWFIHRTSIKLPGAFSCPFWQTLIFQACAAERAVLHAVLALSSVHKRASLEDSLSRTSNALDRQQLFMLREYSQAIHHLHPHFSKNDKKTLRVALITCAVFTCLEGFLGHYRNSMVHLRSGLRLLAQNERDASVKREDGPTSPSTREYIDDWIEEIFLRLHVQAAMLGQIPPRDYSILKRHFYSPLPRAFQSTTHANVYLDHMLGAILCLTERFEQHAHSHSIKSCGEARVEQRRIQACLSSWLEAVKASKTTEPDGLSRLNAFEYKLLRAYHTMARIMVDTCHLPTFESRFDSHTGDFLLLTRQMIELWEDGGKEPVWYTSRFRGTPPKIAVDVANKGWLPLVYFVATKCRVHRLRLQAIKLCSTTPHREGIWDGNLCLDIAREVMRLEERGFYDGLGEHNDFSHDSVPGEGDISLPPLPESYRFNGVAIRLPEDGMGRTVIECKRTCDNASCEVVVREFDPISRHWMDAIPEEP